MMLYYVVNGANIILAFLYIFTFLHGRDNIESNPGPKRLKPNYLSICHWNRNSISPHNISKIAKLKPYYSLYKHGFTCLFQIKHTDDI